MSVDASNACQRPTSAHSPPRLPWEDDNRADAKTSLLEYACNNPSGVRVDNAARAVLGWSGGPTADYQLTRRFYLRDHPGLFVTDRRDDHAWVEPTSAAFHLTASKHNPKPTESDGVAVSTVRRALSCRRKVDSDATRAHLLGALAAKREATAERFVAFEDRTDPSTHLLVPFRTRFNSPARVREQRETFNTAWNRASDVFDRAVMCTLTTDPARFDSLLAATESLMDDVNRLKAWIAARFGNGSRPPSLVVPEFSSRGFPHVHVVLFGVGVVPHGPLSHYWEARCDRGRVVWCDRLSCRDGSWRWASSSSPERSAGRLPRAYLGKSLSAAGTFAAADPVDVHEVAAALRAVDASGGDVDAVDVDTAAVRRGREWWTLACHWATDTRWFTLSPSLRASDGEDVGEAGASRWRFVGVARFGEFPAHVLRGAVVCRERRGRPPPDCS